MALFIREANQVLAIVIVQVSASSHFTVKTTDNQSSTKDTFQNLITEGDIRVPPFANDAS